MEKDNVYVILVNYNSSKETIECIKSIEENEKGCNYKIIVVDNKSTDNSIECLSRIKKIYIIKSKENGGFAKGNNIGIKYALQQGANYVLLLNNDTIITKNAISKMLKKLKQSEDTGIVSCRIMYDSNRELINYCGGKFNWNKGITEHEYYKERYNKKLQDCIDTEFITGCCMLIKKEIFEKVSFLPEEYFMYFEDADFCMQVIKANYKLKVCTNIVIYHKVSFSSGGEESEFAIKWITRNRLIFLNKYKENIKGKKTLLFLYFSRIIRCIQYIITGKPKKAKAIISGMREGRKYIKCKGL